ncbi:MAG TPA: response regulator [Thermoanaerobaculia bacterium]|nr:response regulator [Thermoanaerobaculia bacterium]
MSLLGRLEDLSLTDIVQIVFLSRRTGVLEIENDKGRHTVLFRHGLVVNASAPDHTDLISFLQKRGIASAEMAIVLRKMEDSGIPGGTAAIEMNVIAKEELGLAIRDRILDVVTPLLQSREGEFNFLLIDSMNAVDIEYDPDSIFEDGGFSPQKIVATDGEKLKPLRGLEESLRAGKALLRGDAPEQKPSLDVGLSGAPPTPAAVPPEGAAAVGGAPQDNVVPFRSREESIPELDPDEETLRVPARSTPASGQFKVAGGLFEIESPDAVYRNVVLFEHNPLVRVAAKRAFGKHKIKIFQFGSLEDVRSAITDLFRSNSFFVTFLELEDDDSAVRLMQQIKRRNPRLPVVMVDSEADMHRRHDLLRAGADLYLTRPAPARLQPGMAEEELSLFADELVLFAERSFGQWEEMAGNYGAEAGRKFYEIAQKENLDRSFGVLKQLINELSNPNDIGEVASTIVRLAAEYLERGVLFAVTADEFIGLSGFGRTGGNDDLSKRAKSLQLPRREASLLMDVAASGQTHRGKMRKTPSNVTLIERLGGLLPTEVVALPVMHSERAIGILYGDNAEHHAPIDDITGLEIFLSQAGYAFGNAVLASRNLGRGREGK